MSPDAPLPFVAVHAHYILRIRQREQMHVSRPRGEAGPHLRADRQYDR